MFKYDTVTMKCIEVDVLNDYCSEGLNKMVRNNIL
jgi:hypothetical protein